jgi:hypothetical protein
VAHRGNVGLVEEEPGGITSRPLEPPAWCGWEALALVDAAYQPVAAEHAVIDPVLVDAVAKAGQAHCEASDRSPAYDPGYRPNCRPNDPFAETEGASDYAHALIEAPVCLHQEREDCANCVSQ